MLLPLFIALIVAVLIHELYWKRRNLPPGPMPLPIIGNLHTLARFEPGYGAFEKWRKEYGPVYTYWIGIYPFVMISDYPTLKETFVKDGDAYMNKFNFNESTKEYRGGEFGVVDTNGEAWRDARRFAVHQLRDFGLNRDGMEQRVLLEVDELSKTLEKHQSGDADIQEHIDVAVGSVINQLLFGYRFDEEHLDEFLVLKNLISDQMRTFATPVALMILMFPRLKYFPYFKQLSQKLFFYRDQFYGFFGRQIAHHEQQVDYDSEQNNDYVDAFLKEKRKREQDGDDVSFSIIQLKNMCLDLWFAGMETTSNTLSWGVVYILNNPIVQKKLNEELDREIGSSREINMADKNQLPYMQAVINEIQRLANLLPMNLPHVTTRDVVVNGFKIAKDTGVIAQISTVLYDETVFADPYKFDPERFLDESGKLKKVDELIPFSIGKRQCLGESLARMELFLFTANLFNRFQISAIDPSNPPTVRKTFGTTVQPLPYKVRISKRQ